MASFAEMIYGTAQNVAQDVGKGVPQALQAGAELAQKQETLQQSRAALEQKKQDMELAKFEKVGGWFESYAKMPEGAAKKAFGEKFITNGIQALGLQEKIHPLNMEAMIKDSKVAFGISEIIRNGGDARLLADPEAFMKKYPEAQQLGAANEIAAVAGEYPEMLGKASEQARDRASAKERAVIAAEAAKARGEGIEGRFDQSQKTKLADKVTALGLPGLKTAVTSLDTNIPGGLDGWKAGQPIPGVTGAEGALPLNRLKGKANKIRGDALSVGNQIIKLRTGAAMSEPEANRILGEIGFVPTVGEGGTWTGLTFKGIMSEESFVNGMRRAKAAMQAQESVYKNAYGEDVYESVMKQPKGPSATDDMVEVKGLKYPTWALEALEKKDPKNKYVLEWRNKQKAGK